MSDLCPICHTRHDTSACPTPSLGETLSEQYEAHVLNNEIWKEVKAAYEQGKADADVALTARVKELEEVANALFERCLEDDVEEDSELLVWASRFRALRGREFDAHIRQSLDSGVSDITEDELLDNLRGREG